MHRVLVLGGTGLLGQVVVKTLLTKKSMRVAGTQRKDDRLPRFLNLVPEKVALETILGGSHRYDYVINCIGEGPKGNRNSSVLNAILTNAMLPHQLARAAAKANAKVLNISTDGVFSGKTGNYVESSPPDANDVYGMTKRLGEVRNLGFLNIRCSVVGPDSRRGRGLLEWFLRQPQNSTVTGFVDYLWNGVTSVQLAELLARIIETEAFDNLAEESTLFHFCPNASMTKYELLKCFQKSFKKEVNIVPGNNPRGHMNLTLSTQFGGLRRLYPFGGSIANAVSELSG
jgi:dTDP-4-dehydrorhamnose reductase